MKTKISVSTNQRRVLITGANGGIGREIVSKFLRNEWKVIAAFRTEVGVLKDLKDAAPALEIFQLDLSVENEVDAFYAELKRRDLEPHTVIANAGKYRSRPTPLHKITLAEWEESISANLTTTFLTARGFFRSLLGKTIETPPSLVVVGSTAGIYGEAAHSDYAAAKAALQYGWLKSLKNEITRLHPYGRVNGIAPGWTLTDMAKDSLAERSRVERTLQTIALRKFGAPKDVAEAALFLGDHIKSGHISGHIIEISGGMEGRVLHETSELSGFPPKSPPDSSANSSAN